ncbi:MAG: beta-ketoacyl-[acyl-carrier-protein] synthase family protein [Polaromonas sp.]|uniref:beta-ketoacyl-[acyl-carrier-protein] synthase family protein n=1 Tax=Polaromonas sp. TaxID=1869339 RepID=UPI0018328117|nr:beta-ketoacyl-[acyl-carrier-protein] synthase family protein [Polaromonas sp.]NMM09698.1 beta-ketoacyl-[acyl-carrier-protein] synthase family protein [Polaromonas sp.]
MTALRRVAITGLGVISATGTGAPAFFESLLAARSGIRSIDILFPTGTESVLAGAIDFDPDPHFSRAQSLTMDRVSQFALVAAREAMAQAGLSVAGIWPSGLARERFGVSMGTGSGGASSIEAAYTALLEQRVARLRPMTVVLAMNNAIAAHVSMEFGLKGPSSTISNACASSANSIGEAFRQIRHGYADAMLAGGSEALLVRGSLKAWQAMHTLAKPHSDGVETSCRPFSIDRTGLVLAEGAGMLVLEEWESAKRRGATILAELSGYASTSDAHHLTQPEAQSQARAMRLALEDARLDSSAIGYLNAHGTATEVGDVVESIAIKLAFPDAAQRLPVSSTKGVHGHAMGAAGALEFIASVMALRTEQLPPTAFLQHPDPRCDLDYIPQTARDCPGLRVVMSNSFAFGGSNAVLIASAA